MHLDAETWRGLLDGALPEDQTRRVIAHLEGGCARCEQLLAGAVTRGETDALDGIVDEVLLELAPSADTERVDDVGFARIRGVLRQRARRRQAVTAAGIAVAVAAAALLTVSIRASDPWRLKGSATTGAAAPALEILQVIDGAPTPLARGAQVPIGATLVFRVGLATPSCVQLWRGAGRPSALLDQPLCLDRGVHVLERGGEALGLQVQEPGPTLFSVAVQVGTATGAAVPDAAPQSEFRLEVVEPARAGARR